VVECKVVTPMAAMEISAASAWVRACEGECNVGMEGAGREWAMERNPMASREWAVGWVAVAPMMTTERRVAAAREWAAEWVAVAPTMTTERKAVAVREWVAGWVAATAMVEPVGGWTARAARREAVE